MSYQLPIPGPTEPLQPYDQIAPQSARGQRTRPQTYSILVRVSA
jgi:hypothetical protein